MQLDIVLLSCMAANLLCSTPFIIPLSLSNTELVKSVRSSVTRLLLGSNNDGGSKLKFAAADTFLNTNDVLSIQCKLPDGFLFVVVVYSVSCIFCSLSVGEENVHSPEQRGAHQERSAEGGL